MQVFSLLKNHSVLYVLTLSPLLSILPELYGNPHSFEKYFFIPSSTILGVASIVLTILRIKGFSIVPSFLYRLLYFFFPLTLTISVSLSIIDFFTPANFVYSKIPINYDKFFFISLYTLLLLFLHQDNTYFKRNFQKLCLILPIIFFLILVTINLWPFDRFLQLIKEDNLIEYMQFFTLLLGAYFSFLLGKLLKSNKKKMAGILFFCIAFGLFATAGDEISWGQRILGIETPDRIKEINYQNETGFHNTPLIDGYVPTIYMVAGLFGITAHFIQKPIEKIIKRDLSLFTPPGYLTIFFLFPFIYNLYTNTYVHSIGKWSEVAELYLYSGVTIFIATNYFKRQTK
jgi:hypothetical protein